VQQSASTEQLKQRRRQLQQQRRIRAVKSLWRFSCMGGILAGVGWLANQANWQISKPEQVRIEGNNYLNDETIRSILAISYPKLMMEIAPAQITAQLLDRASISTVRIDRSLLAPHLIVRVQDLPPVARLMVDEHPEPQQFVDELGRQVPISSYRTAVVQSPPRLQLRPAQRGVCPGWTQIYRAVRTSPILIGIVDCRDPQNLTLQTEIGEVRLGSFRDEASLNDRMQQLDRLRNWRSSMPHPEAVNYLDLENPDAPFIQTKSQKTIPKLP
jgi:cell division protein FtsQ